MTPEERQLLADLFDRIRAVQANPRDGEAEAFIADAVRAVPSAPYLLAQSVIVQEHALRATDDKIQALESQLRDLQNPASAPVNQSSGSFLGGLGRSLFGGEPAASAPPPHNSVPPSGPWGNQGAYAPPPPQPSQAPWSTAPQAPVPAGGGGSFLHGALGAAAGVAGGVLLANSIRGLFSNHNNPLGIGSGLGGGLGGLGGGLGGLGGGLGQTGSSGETVVNNYYETADDTGSRSIDADHDDNMSSSDDADFQDSSGDWGNGDGTTDV